MYEYFKAVGKYAIFHSVEDKINNADVIEDVWAFLTTESMKLDLNDPVQKSAYIFLNEIQQQLKSCSSLVEMKQKMKKIHECL